MCATTLGQIVPKYIQVATIASYVVIFVNYSSFLEFIKCTPVRPPNKKFLGDATMEQRRTNITYERR